MQGNTGSSSSQWHRSSRELLARVVRLFTGESPAGRPGLRWAEMKPVDFQGDDTSLTEAHLALMR